MCVNNSVLGRRVESRPHFIASRTQHVPEAMRRLPHAVLSPLASYTVPVVLLTGTPASARRRPCRSLQAHGTVGRCSSAARPRSPLCPVKGSGQRRCMFRNTGVGKGPSAAGKGARRQPAACCKVMPLRSTFRRHTNAVGAVDATECRVSGVSGGQCTQA